MDTTQKNGTISFWKRPEGTTGKYMLYGVIAAAGWLLWHFQEQLVNFADNMMHLTIVGSALVAFYLVITSERPRTLIFYAYQMLCRAITAQFVDIDPIAILQTFHREMEKKGEQVNDSIGRINGVSRALDEEIKRNQREMDNALKLADVAKDEDSLNAQALKAGRRNANIQKYQDMKQVIAQILDALTRVKKRVDFHIQNSQDEMNELINENRMSKMIDEGVKAARGVLGKSDELAVRNLAADRIREKYGNALGELDGLIQMSQNLDSEIDLSQLAFQQDGKAKLAELRQKLTQVESGTPVRSIAAPAAYPQLTPGQSQIITTPASQTESVWAKRLKRPE